MRILGLIVLIYSFTSLSGLLSIGLIMGSFALKKKASNMDGEKWDLYFKSMSNCAYVLRFGLLYLISLSLIVALSYFVFGAFHFENPIVLSGLTLILGLFRMTWLLATHRTELFEKITKIRDS